MNVSIGQEVKLSGRADLWTMQFEFWMANGGLAVAAKKMKQKGVPCSMVIGWMRVRKEWANIAETCIREASWL